MIFAESEDFRDKRPLGIVARALRRLHLDGPLLLALIVVASVGMLILYSASGQDLGIVLKQSLRFGISVLALVLVAQIPPHFLRLMAPWIYLTALLLLFGVMIGGDVGKGAQRWLDLGFIRFQPSEIMKLSLPLMAAWYLHQQQLPPGPKSLVVVAVLVLVPTVLVGMQPDLGTALLIAASGFIVILIAGMSFKMIAIMVVLGLSMAPVLWTLMKDYQRNRVLTFLNPETDPLGAGYHIIQSKIAIGSGGVFGKGWNNGTQAQLEFLPERSTDFIFAVLGEEFGLIGMVVLLSIYVFIIARGLLISAQARNTFSRLLAGAISLTFFVYVFVNAGMVSGLLPVVGVPLPLVSYGGTSMVTLMAGFGILMSIQTNRKLLST
ncbi:MAG: rod shape-determining protein RodA [Gammaproteobacteria bacterium]|nr:rod shape-determining protein RodA [Gammaproteobacteria bacterium]MDH3767626.1 rod shape-determining protein RodA [Gammaproteobacteria bacterium]